MSLRILIQSEGFSPELISTGKYTGEMAEWLATQGHEVRVVTTAPHYPKWQVFDGYSSWKYTSENRLPAGLSGGFLRVVRCPSWIPRPPRGWRRILYLGSFAISSWPVMLLQSFWKPDIILLIEPTFFCSPHALAVATLCGGTSWLHIQDFEVDVAFQLGDFSSSQLRRQAQNVERFLLRRFNRVSAISERMVERIKAKGVAHDRTSLFPNWVDTSIIYPLGAPSGFRKQLGISEHAIVALYSGNMGLKQGLQLLGDVAAEFAGHLEVQFVFCGDGPYREVLAKLATTNGNVTILPLQPAEKLNELLNLADIHLLPQVANAADLVMPSKLTGMMASGRPVIATAHAGSQLSEVLKGRGIVTPPGDVNQFVSALNRLAADAEQRRKMGENARKYAVEHMDRDRILRQFEASLMQACGHSSIPIHEGLSAARESSPRIS